VVVTAAAASRGSYEPLLRVAPAPSVLDGRVGASARAVYRHSADGVDENLLICLHGLGDGAASLARFGAALALPQTAVWALQGRHEVPLIGGGAWYTSLDAATGDVIPPRTPHRRRARDITDAVDGLLATLRALTAGDAGWPRDAIHLLGFGDGATLALHVAAAIAAGAGTTGTGAPPPLCSIVAIGGDLVTDALPSMPPATGVPPTAAALPHLYYTAFSDGDEGAAGSIRQLAGWWGEPAALVAEGGGRPAAAPPYTAALLRGAARLPATRAATYPLMAHFSSLLRRRLVALERDPTVVRVA